MFKFHLIDQQVILKELSNLNEKKATGPDDIPAKFIKLAAFHLAEPLTYIINLSLSTASVPNDMKIARVMALFKNKGEKTSPSNYRPISILPIFSKVLEKVVNQQVQTFITTNKLIFPNQYGFQCNKSTCDALLKFSDKCFRALNDSESVLGIFIDFSKAFDTVDHQILLKKLNIYYNFSDSSVSWFSSYL